jgi:hypothetical protein
MDIQHEGGKRPFQARQLATKNDKPRTGKLGGHGKIHLAKPLADGDMVARGEIE